MIIIKNKLIYLLAAAVLFSYAAAALTLISSSLPDELSISCEEEAKISTMPNISISVRPQNNTATARLFGVLPVKTISVSTRATGKVLLCGTSIGIKLRTDGIVVVETGSVMTESGIADPAKSAGVRAGDIIMTVDGEKVTSVGKLSELLAASGGKQLDVRLLRDGKTVNTVLTPALSRSDGKYRAGLWVRDGTAGIGALTYIDPQTRIFGGLGHAICDYDAGCLLPVSGGEATGAEIIGVTPGAPGAPGELLGYLNDDILGTVELNGENGVFGYFSAPLPSSALYDVAPKQTVEEGAAELLFTLPGKDTAESFSIIIEKINYDSQAQTRNMIIRVTDKRLLDATGGIVQGMSGAPIIQNGRFAAVATHVFVNDPTMGYALFAENMVAAGNALMQTQKAA